MNRVCLLPEIPFGVSYAVITMKPGEPGSGYRPTIELFPDRAAWEGWVKKHPGIDCAAVTINRAKVTTVTSLSLELSTEPKTTPQLRNCWSCRRADATAMACGIVWKPEIVSWVRETHNDGKACPKDADGCPGWEAK